MERRWAVGVKQNEDAATIIIKKRSNKYGRNESGREGEKSQRRLDKRKCSNSNISR